MPGGDGQPGYTFSVGHFLNLNHPELIVLGLKDSLASRLLDSAAVRIRGLNKPYQPYRLYNDIADGLEVMSSRNIGNCQQAPGRTCLAPANKS